MSAWQTLFPFPSHRLMLEGGVQLHYLDEGPRDAPPVVMIHGNPTWAFYYRTLIPGLSRTHRVIVPDHIGCGLSDKPQDYPYTLEQHIRNLEALLLHLDLRDVTLALHDWGGAIGLGFATRHPERIARLVLFNTAAFYLPAVPWVLRLARSRGLGELLLRGFNAFSLSACRFGLHHRERMSPQVRVGYLAPYDSWANRIAVYRFVRDIPIEVEHPTRRTIDVIDRKLALFADRPVLICWGARDFVFTARDFLPAWQQRFPNAQTHVFEDAGHYVVEDAHERILPLIQMFLSQPETATAEGQGPYWGYNEVKDA